MPCGCGGAKVPAIPVTSGDNAGVEAATVQRAPGMPRYRVVGSQGGDDKLFDTYGAARAYKQAYGGAIRAV